MAKFHTFDEYDSSYAPPRENVLLLSCMDLRLLDDTVQFMDHDNLTNRYDHIVFAGAALGALGGSKRHKKKYEHWMKCFKDHLGAAIDLHQVKDLYILEHRHCGAYHKVFKVHEEFGDTVEDQIAEAALHLHYAEKLEKRIAEWGYSLRTHTFLMDLRGHVIRLK